VTPRTLSQFEKGEGDKSSRLLEHENFAERAEVPDFRSHASFKLEREATE